MKDKLGTKKLPTAELTLDGAPSRVTDLHVWRVGKDQYACILGLAARAELSADSVLSRVDDVARMLLSSEPEQLEHLKMARRMFECGLVRVAAQSAGPHDIADLRDIVAA